MITRLRAENFKSWKKTGEVRLAPLTGLFGSNSSGKTSILQLLLMLKQTVESSDRKRVLHTGDDSSLVDLGTFYDLVYGHSPDAALKLELSWTLPEPLVIYDPEQHRRPLYQPKSLTFETEIHQEGETQRPVVNRFEYRFDSQAFGMRRQDSNEQGDKGDRDKYDLIHTGYDVKRMPGRPWPLPAPVKCYGFPDEAWGYYQNTGFLLGLGYELEQMLSRVAYLGPLREYPRRTYVWGGERPVDVGRRGDQAVAALLAARTERLKGGRGRGKARRYKPIEERILEWLQEMKLIHSFTLKSVAAQRKDYEFRARKTAASPEVLITELGFGVSQVLPVLVLCYYAPEGSTILLEQPEIHLHPFVQAALADVLIDVVNERKVQVIVESHSEHLLRRLQRRVAEEVLSPEHAALYFVRIEDDASTMEALDMDPYGNVLNWPDDFFGDEMGELAAMTKAAIQRRRAAS